MKPDIRPELLRLAIVGITIICGFVCTLLRIDGGKELLASGVTLLAVRSRR